jgi:hypothetical protein
MRLVPGSVSDRRPPMRRDLGPLRVCLLALALGAGLASPPTVGRGEAGQVSRQRLAPEAVAARAELAVIARVLPGGGGRPDDGQRPLAVPVPDVGERRCGPLRGGAWRVEIVEVIAEPLAAAGPISGLQVGDVVPVFPGDLPSLIAITAGICAGEPGVSPVFDRGGGVRPRAGRRYVLLLRHVAGLGWIEAVGGSFFPLAQRGAWAARLDPAGRPRRPPIFEPTAATEPDLCAVDADCRLTGPLICDACGSCPDADGEAWPLSSLRRYRARCEHHRHQLQLRPTDGPPLPPAPACAPCPGPSAHARTRRAVCRARRCAVSGD